MYNYIKIIIIFISILFSGCNSDVPYIGAKNQVESFEERTINITNNFDLQLDMDFANIEFFSSKNNDVKFEINKVIKGLKYEKHLKKYLNDFDIKLQKNKNTIILTSKYKGKIKSIFNKYINLKVYIPYKIKTLKYKLDTGNIKFQDDFKGELVGDVNIANIEINNIEGKIMHKIGTGTIKIFNGNLKNASSIQGKILHAYIKSNFVEKASCSVSTRIGNIDFMLPKAINVHITSIGIVKKNEFRNVIGNTNSIYLKSEMGSITIKRY